MKIYRNLLSFIVAFTLSTANAATVTIDGQVMDVEVIEIHLRSNNNNTPAPTPEPTPEPAPEPTPEPEPSGSCGDLATRSIDWSSPGGRQDLSIGSAGIVYSLKTTDNPDYAGYINLFEKTGYESVSRRVTLSQCPGEPVNNRCTRTGTGLISVPWIQREYSGACSLKPNTVYYIEVSNFSGCNQSACGAYLSVPTNGKP